MPAATNFLVSGILLVGFLSHCAVCAFYRRCREVGASEATLRDECYRWTLYLFVLSISVIASKGVLFAYGLPWWDSFTSWSYEVVPDGIRIAVAAMPLIIAVTGKLIFRVRKHWVAWSFLVVACVLSGFYHEWMTLLSIFIPGLCAVFVLEANLSSTSQQTIRG